MNKCVYKNVYYIYNTYYTYYVSLVYKLSAINAVCRLVSGSKNVCRG